MFEIPKDPKKIRERIRRYERKLREEKHELGAYDDGAGKRYLLGFLYMLMGDLDGALESFRWFEAEFPDDDGEPGQYLCWSLALYRSGDEAAAARKLRRAMLMNLYLVPRLLGKEARELDIWYGSSDEEPSYVERIPEELLSLWSEDERRWASGLYHGSEFTLVRERYVEVQRKLRGLPPGEERSRLVDEARALRDPHGTGSTCRPGGRGDLEEEGHSSDRRR